MTFGPVRALVAGAIACLLAGTGAAEVENRDLERAKRIVEDIYYNLPLRVAPVPPYAPELRRWIARDAAFARRTQSAGTLDWIPFCGCQDFAPDFRLMRLTASPRGAGRAKIWVTLRNGGLQNFTLDMVQTNGRWRIADIHGSSTPSLLAYLRREVPREEAGLRRRHKRS